MGGTEGLPAIFALHDLSVIDGGGIDVLIVMGGDDTVVVVLDTCWVCVDDVGGAPPLSLPHPEPPVGTKLTGGSFPQDSDFKLGKLRGRRAMGTFPKIDMPCLFTRDFCWFGFEESPFDCEKTLFRFSV